MDVRELVASVDIVEYIGQYIDLEQRGDEWWGLSCFKEERTPSFSVRKNPPVFFDYSSGIGGNIITFIKKKDKCSGKRAVQILADYAGINLYNFHAQPELKATSVCKRFKKKETTNRSDGSGVALSEHHMEMYENNYEKAKIWLDEGISEESLKKFQVRYDRMSNRLVYPIRNRDGFIVNVGGRTLDPEWKEKGIRKYTYFYHWGKMDVIYGLYENFDSIKAQNEIILFEGAKSVMHADSWGIKNTGCLLTSHLNPEQLKLLVWLGVRVVFALDKDVAVWLDKNVNKLKQYVNVSFLFDDKGLLDEKDSPVDKGEHIFRLLYENRRRLR